MPAYQTTTLNHLAIHRQAEEALQMQWITVHKEQEIKMKYPVELYMPHFFVKLGLGVLTIFILLAAFGLLALMIDFNSLGAVSFILGVACYGFLEYLIASRKHYNSGVDNVLMGATILLFTGAVSSMVPVSINEEAAASLCICMVALYLCFRFTDAGMALIGGVALLYFFLKSALLQGGSIRAVIPFFMILVSLLLYGLSKWLLTLKPTIYYKDSLWLLAITALCGIYLFGNYYAVHQLQGSVTGTYPVEYGSVRLAWFFWLWTMAVPIVYMVLGIVKRDLVFARLSIILSVASVLTFRYYYAILPVEQAMLFAGTLLVLGSYLLIIYLQKPKIGFTFEDIRKTKKNKPDIEGIVIGEIFADKGTPAVQPETEFGGGSFGGAGAGEKY